MASASRSRLHRRGAIALLAVWALALLPTLSQLLTRVTGDSAWAEVCKTQGTRWVALGEGGAPATGVLEHCPFCGASTAVLGLPPAVASWAAPVVTFVRADGAPAARRPSAAWVHAQPRGPPADRA